MKAKAVALIVILFLIVPSVWAVQEHKDPEDLYAHEAGHLFFALSMLYLFAHVWGTPSISKGWRLIGYSALLFFFWNLDAFTTIWIRELLNPNIFTGSAVNWSQEVDVSTALGKIWYLGKILDHFFLVGAGAFFLLGVRRFRAELEADL